MTVRSTGSGTTGITGRATIAILLAALALASIAGLMFAGPTFADPPDTLISPPDHRHFVVTPDGDLVPVGPQICGNPKMQQAFNEFHYNIHGSFVPGIGLVPTLGPQGGAPGLHNDLGAARVIGVPGCG